MKQYDAVALGELLIDFTQHGVSEQGNLTFEANPGGAPCNVLAMLSKLGRTCAFIGKVGQDRFGSLLQDALTEQQISTDALMKDAQVPTTLALVHKLPSGDRDFSFYRGPGADMMLTAAEVPAEMIENCRAFHFGTLSMTDEPVRSATMHAVGLAEKAGCVISFDPNLRPPLWKDPEDARAAFDYGMKHCHVLKISDNEIEWYTGKSVDEGLTEIRAAYPNIRLLLASLGPDGSRACCGAFTVEQAAYLNPDTIETTGAGDTFCACCIDAVLTHGLDGLDETALRTMLKTANAAASIVTTRKGALRVMPTPEEVRALIAARG